MIFGFNTDIRHEDTVYHVQSEAREAEHLLQTQVFVRGRCVGKRAVPYGSTPAEGIGAENINSQGEANEAKSGEVRSTSDDQEKEKILRELHREVLDAIREGKLDSILDKRETPEALAVVKELDVEWVNAKSVHAAGTLTMHMRVTDGSAIAPGARLTLRFARPNAAPYYAQVLTDAAGNAHMNIQVDEESLAESSITVQANFDGRRVTRKFKLREAA
jgi:ribosomal protein L22